MNDWDAKATRIIWVFLIAVYVYLGWLILTMPR